MKNGKWKMENYFRLLTLISCFTIFMQSANAFEDCIITTNGKLTDIKIQYNDIIDVYPLVTVENDKNTLIIHPLKEGETKFTVLKNKKEKYLFNVKVTDDRTFIEVVEGFGILAIDQPPVMLEESIDLDSPPILNDTQNKTIDNELMIQESKRFQEYIDNLDEPPELRGED